MDAARSSKRTMWVLIAIGVAYFVAVFIYLGVSAGGG